MVKRRYGSDCVCEQSIKYGKDDKNGGIAVEDGVKVVGSEYHWEQQRRHDGEESFEAE